MRKSIIDISVVMIALLLVILGSKLNILSSFELKFAGIAVAVVIILSIIKTTILRKINKK